MSFMKYWSKIKVRLSNQWNKQAFYETPCTFPWLLHSPISLLAIFLSLLPFSCLPFHIYYRGGQKYLDTRQAWSMIHSAWPKVLPVANIGFCCFVFLDMKSGTDGWTDNMSENNDPYRPAVTLGWPSGSKT